LEEIRLTLDLTGCTQEQLKTLRVSDVLNKLEGTGEDGASERVTIAGDAEIVWAYFKDASGKPLDDVYHEVGRGDTVDVSSYYSLGSFVMQLIVGTANQLDPANKRYIVTVTVNPVPSYIYGSLYTQDGGTDKRTALLSSSSYYWTPEYSQDGDVETYVAYISPAYDPAGEYYLGLRHSSAYDDAEFNITVYKGHFDTEDEVETAAASNVTSDIWVKETSMNGNDAGYKARYDTPQLFTIVAKTQSNVFVTLQKISVRLQVNLTGLQVNGLMTAQRAGNAVEKSNNGTLRLDDIGSDFEAKSLWLGVPTRFKETDEYRLRLSLTTTNTPLPAWPGNLDVKVYEGIFENAADAEAAASADPSADVTTAVWTGDCALKYNARQDFTLVVKSETGIELAVKNFYTFVSSYPSYVSPLGLHRQEGADKVNLSDGGSNPGGAMRNDVIYYTYTLDASMYFANAKYFFGFRYYSGEIGDFDNSKVSKAVVGHYDSLQAASGQADIKGLLITDTYTVTSTNKRAIIAGYEADYSGAGVPFTVFAEGNVYKFTIMTANTTAPPSDSAAKPLSPKQKLYFAVTDAYGQEGDGTLGIYKIEPVNPFSYKPIDIQDIWKNNYNNTDYDDIDYTVHDSYYYNGYRTLLVSSAAIDLKKIKPVFITKDDAGSIYANGILQESGETTPGFSDGVVTTYSATLGGDVRALNNFFVTFVKINKGGAKLFVNGPDKREIYLDNYYDNRHDIFIANVGDEALTGLNVTLTDAVHVKLDDYWTVGGSDVNTTLAAFTTTDKGSLSNYGELPNVAKIRLLPDGEGPVSGTLTISAAGQTSRRIELTGYAGNPKIITDKLPDAVKYVPYAFLVQTNNMHDWINVEFEPTDEDSWPRGMELKSNGEIYGAPLEEGRFDIEVRATYSDSDGKPIPGFKPSAVKLTLTVLADTDYNVDNSTDVGYALTQKVPRTVARIQDYKFISEGKYVEFRFFRLDGIPLRENIDYTREDGSTVITIRAQTYSKYGAGDQTIAAEFREESEEGDGYKDLKRAAQKYTLDFNGGGSGSSGGSNIGGGGGSGGGGGGGSGDATPTTPGTTTPPARGGAADEESEDEDASETNAVARFTDIRGHWAESAILAVVERGLFNGVSETRFNADGTLSRAMLVTVLWRLDGRSAPNAASLFADLDANVWYSDAIAWAAENKIVQGYASGSFGVNDAVTREQIVTILFRYADYADMDVSGRAEIDAFTDAASVPSWAAEATAWAVHAGLIRGRDDNTISPSDSATRAEFATIIVRFLDLKSVSDI
jgi:hypothetical protein